MAIIIEQEKSKTNWFALLLMLFILGVAGILIYYLFFVSPATLEKAINPSLQSVKDLSQAELNPEEVFNRTDFKSLNQHVGPIQLGQGGKLNPFSR